MHTVSNNCWLLCFFINVVISFDEVVKEDEETILQRIDEQLKNNKNHNMHNEDNDEMDEFNDERRQRSNMYTFLYKRLKENSDEKSKSRQLNPDVYLIPGPQEPLPGRSHLGNYWPVFPFHNQFSGGLDLDPALSRHIGGDINIAVPSWGMMDIYGRFFNRIHDTTTKFGHINYPVNMLDLDETDFVKLISDPSLQYNRNTHPLLPLGKLAKTYVPLSCKPPMCNPYHASFGFGLEHDFGGSDGVEGDIDVPIPISKSVAYRFPFSGNVYAFRDNITVTYGQNLAAIDPFSSLFDYQKRRDPSLAIPRQKRNVPFSKKATHRLLENNFGHDDINRRPQKYAPYMIPVIRKYSWISNLDEDIIAILIT
ncbi:hypothetical protein DICVIV_09820 [Dictyocaulus viviparus]|uniref:Uncharacterized protein n=1 Tax=Dictyocaulus viviparus TaxID=29172 RepID=A0A0D8XJX2_DICVI|nr:hypothetical protein DICVIV_09820 [Dictyocaulus viviparus]